MREKRHRERCVGMDGSRKEKEIYTERGDFYLICDTCLSEEGEEDGKREKVKNKIEKRIHDRQ